MSRTVRAALIAVIVALVPGCATSTTADPSTSTTMAPTPNPGLAFDGMYDVAIVDEVRDDISPNPASGQRVAFAVESSCPSSDGPCVASVLATYPDVDPIPPAASLVLDYVDGTWTSVTEMPATQCTTPDGQILTAPAWVVGELSQPDGVTDGSAFAGTSTTYWGAPCAKKATSTVTLTRTGPRESAAPVPPAADLPAYTPSPASTLEGGYDLELTPIPADAARAQAFSESGRFRVICSRSGDRCAGVSMAKLKSPLVAR